MWKIVINPNQGSIQNPNTQMKGLCILRLNKWMWKKRVNLNQVKKQIKNNLERDLHLNLKY